MDKPAERVNVRLKVAPEQRAALDRVAAERGITVSELLRDAIAKATKVADPLPKGMPRESGGPPRKSKT